jgi:hypothetical protein
MEINLFADLSKQEHFDKVNKDIDANQIICRDMTFVLIKRQQPVF